MVSDAKINPEEVKQQLVAAFPAKVARKRTKAIVINAGQEEVPEIAANTRTVPGLITMRGCAYAGCKGVIMGLPVMFSASPTARSAVVFTAG
jgi:nitrogenase molybdenum-iron protein alpha chain